MAAADLETGELPGSPQRKTEERQSTETRTRKKPVDAGGEYLPKGKREVDGSAGNDAQGRVAAKE